MRKINGWSRAERTIDNADPTTTVTWKKGDVTITEAHNVYVCTVGLARSVDEYLAVELHKTLESLAEIA